MTRKPQNYAYCWASGQIEFGTEVPDGCLTIASHVNEVKLRETIDVLARHGYEKGVLLVPGVPEADNQSDGYEAFIRFSNRVNGALAK